MSKAFTRQPNRDEDNQLGDEAGRAAAATFKNYITPTGLQRLKDERRFLLIRERPAVTQVVAWAASNGDRSENADYQYNKRRLRQIDRRIRFLTKGVDAGEGGGPEAPGGGGRAPPGVFWGGGGSPEPARRGSGAR